jgi:hypothetical protein
MTELRGLLRGLRAGRRSMRILPQILALVALLSIGPFPHPVLLAPYRVLGCGETEGVGHFEDSCDWPPARWQHRAPALVHGLTCMCAVAAAFAPGAAPVPAGLRPDTGVVRLPEHYGELRLTRIEPQGRA